MARGTIGSLTEAQIQATTTRRDLLEPGTPAYAYQTVKRIKLLWEFKSSHNESWQEALKDMLEPVPVWELIPEKRPYGSAERLCREELKIPLDKFIDTIKVLLGPEYAYSDKLLEPFSSHGGQSRARKNVVDNIGVDIVNSNNNVKLNEDGNAANYAVRRLKRDRPDLAQKVIVGDISPNAAMIEAGFRAKTISIPIDPERAARSIKRHFDEDQIEELIDLLQ